MDSNDTEISCRESLLMILVEIIHKNLENVLLFFPKIHGRLSRRIVCIFWSPWWIAVSIYSFIYSDVYVECRTLEIT